MALNRAAVSRNAAPNARELESAEAALSYPIPVVRKFQVQLQSSLDETRSRIRSLVGDSYRELLQSADIISNMHAEMQKLNIVLDDVSINCSARVVDKAIKTCSEHDLRHRGTKTQQRRLAAELALSQACIAAALTVNLRDSPLLVARLVVISRLLLQDLDSVSYDRGLLTSLWLRHRKLSRRMLRAFDRTLCDYKLERRHILDALLAHALLTSSTPTSVLRHFLHARQTALAEILLRGSVDDLHIAHDMVFATVQQTQQLFPTRLSDALSQLQNRPLLQDPKVLTMPELNMNLYQEWVADSVQRYSHWTRHDTLDSKQAVSMISDWSLNAFVSLKQALKSCLDDIDDLSRITKLRKDLISKWLEAPTDLSTLDKILCITELRHCFESSSVRAMTRSMRTIATHVQQQLTEAHTAAAPEYLWDTSINRHKQSKGINEFRQQIAYRAQGKNSSIYSMSQKLAAWAASLDDARQCIKAMRDTRWVEASDLVTADAQPDLVTQLRQDDPAKLEEQLVSGYAKSIDDVNKMLSEAILECAETSGRVQYALHLLRLVREVMSFTAPESQTQDLSNAVSKAHTCIATSIVSQSAAYADSLEETRSLLECKPLIVLWQGEPALPSQPSTACVRLVYEAHKAMRVFGQDIWTVALVAAVKMHLANVIKAAAEKYQTKLQDHAQNVNIDESKDTADADTVPSGEEATSSTDDKRSSDTSQRGKPEAEVEAETSTEPAATVPVKSNPSHAPEAAQQALTQLLFDIAYLSRLLLPHGTDAGNAALSNVESKLKSDCQVDTDGWTRIQKYVLDCHKRTYLLYGLFL